MTIYLVLAYDWDGIKQLWGFSREEDAWKFAQAQTDKRFEYSVEPLTLDTKESV